MSTDLEPWVSVALPSKFKTYATKECFLRPLKVVEVKRLKPALLSGNYVAMLDVLKESIKPLALDELTNGDYWFCVAWLRLNTFKSSPLTFPWTCDSCDTHNTFKFLLNKMEMRELPDEFEEPAYLTLPSGLELPIRLPRIGDNIKTANYLQVVNGSNEDIVEQAIADTAILIQNGETLEKRIELVRGLDPEDDLTIEAFLREFSHGLPVMQEDTCKECGHTQHVHTRFRPHQILADVRSGESVRASVRFGKKAESE